MRRPWPIPWLAGLVCVSAASAGGVYESVPIDNDEWRLIEESQGPRGLLQRAVAALHGAEGPGARAPRRSRDSTSARLTTTSSTSSSCSAIRRRTLRATERSCVRPHRHARAPQRRGSARGATRARDQSRRGPPRHRQPPCDAQEDDRRHGARWSRRLGSRDLDWSADIRLRLSAATSSRKRTTAQSKLLLASRYDPHALPEVFDILGRDYEGLESARRRPFGARTPRFARAPKRAAHSSPECRGASANRDAFEAAVMDMRAMTIEDYVQDDFPHTAVALAESLVERYPNDPRLLPLARRRMARHGRTGPARHAGRSRTPTSGKTGAIELARHARSAWQSCSKPRKAVTAYAANLKRAEETYQRVIATDSDVRARIPRLGRGIRAARTHSRRGRELI